MKRQPLRFFASLAAGLLLALLAGLLIHTGCNKSGGETNSPPADDPFAPTQAQPKLPTIKLWLGAEELAAEMALTAQQERTGMMFRTNMAETEGMIFVLPYTQRASFWMKNCYVPLSAAYIDPDGVIQEIHDLQPQNTNTVVATSDNIRFVLETPQGWFDRHHVRTGMTVRTEKGPLADTFRAQR